MGRISKGDANHLRALDPGRAIISWRDAVAAAEGHRRCQIGRLRWPKRLLASASIFS
jgi:hypothetical protein